MFAFRSTVSWGFRAMFVVFINISLPSVCHTQSIVNKLLRICQDIRNLKWTSVCQDSAESIHGIFFLYKWQKKLKQIINLNYWLNAVQDRTQVYVSKMYFYSYSEWNKAAFFNIFFIKKMTLIVISLTQRETCLLTLCLLPGAVAAGASSARNMFIKPCICYLVQGPLGSHQRETCLLNPVFATWCRGRWGGVDQWAGVISGPNTEH